MLGYAFVHGGYLATVMSFALIYAIFVTGLNLFMGYAGQVSSATTRSRRSAVTARRC